MFSKKVQVIFQFESSCDYSKLLEWNVEYCADENCQGKLGNLDADLIILDCAVETEARIELLKKIKQIQPSIPVIIVTGFDSEDFVIKAFKNGARDIFKKPVNGKELRKSVDSVLWLRQESLKKRSTSPFNYMDDHQETLQIPDNIPENIVRAIGYIQNNLLGPLNLDKIAKEAYMSKFHFSRIFKKHVGFPPMQYVTTMRFKKAMTLLQQKDLKISAVAINSGFSDLSQFNKQFKKLYGSSPSAFKETIRAR